MDVPNIAISGVPSQKATTNRDRERGSETGCDQSKGEDGSKPDGKRNHHSGKKTTHVSATLWRPDRFCHLVTTLVALELRLPPEYYLDKPPTLN